MLHSLLERGPFQALDTKNVALVASKDSVASPSISEGTQGSVGEIGVVLWGAPGPVNLSPQFQGAGRRRL